jgi:hypothetical protein
MNHLKLITPVLGILLAAVAVKAQETKEDPDSSRFSYGVKAGAAFSAFTFGYEPFTDKKAGVFAGVFAEYTVFGFLSVSAEPAYIQKGALNLDSSFLYDDAGVYDPYIIMVVNKVTSHHVQLPLVFHLKLPAKTCKVVPSLSLGGSAAYTFNVRARNLLYYDILNDQRHFETMTEGITRQFEPWEFHVLAGPRLDFLNPVADVILEVNYCVGLSRINKYQYKNQFYNFSSNSWIFTLGFRIK